MALKTCSLQYAKDHKFFGPVWHGSSADKREMIEKEGFKIFYGDYRRSDAGISNGYDDRPYWDGIPAPIHHLGFGIYFTTVLAIAKQFNLGTTRGLVDYYIDTQSNDVINFGANKTMMQWWIKNGYDPAVAKVDRVTATRLMTDRLKGQFDSVWFKGKGLYRLLDGDQLCVYDPDIIYKIDKALTQPGEVGSLVIRNTDGMRGKLLEIREIPEHARQYHNGETSFLTVRWNKGGTDYNVYPSTVTFK
jgi:hypothetical protein